MILNVSTVLIHGLVKERDLFTDVIHVQYLSNFHAPKFEKVDGSYFFGLGISLIPSK